MPDRCRTCCWPPPPPFHCASSSPPSLQFEYPILLQTLGLIVYGNIILGLFNLVPIPPLDGGTILLSLVSRETAWQLRPILSQYGLLILIAVFFFPVFGGETLGGRVLYPIADAIFSVLVG